MRTEHIVNGVNATLLAFSGKKLGDLSHTPGRSDLVYVPNESHCATGGKVLNIAGTTVETLRRVSPAYKGVSRTGLKPWVKRLSTKAWKTDKQLEFPTFSSTTVMGQVNPAPKSTSSPSPSPSLSPPSRNRKVAHDDSVSPSPKRPKMDANAHAVELDAAIQYNSACNGLQILCSSWDRIHSFNMTLQDNSFGLKWYDSQGCIEAEAIDVITQLPLLVMALALFQPFNLEMHGRADLDLSLSADGIQVPFEVPVDARPQWQLKGRHTVLATPVPKGTAQRLREGSQSCRTRSRASTDLDDSAQAFLDDLYFKLCWRDERRTSEADIISTAKERAAHYLPNPDQIYSSIAQLGNNGVPNPSLMVMNKLLPLDILEPAKFKVFIWEIIRCLRLLWQIGIAHGDLSFWNMMHARNGNRLSGILIDFDHAMIMQPGSRTPPTSSLELAGTLPFIAMEMGTKSVKSHFNVNFATILNRFCGACCGTVRSNRSGSKARSDRCAVRNTVGI
ncbi:hypothetical protein BKA70DRAFT_1565945 [Coprinopsis sp. MPI-PUGE-AT-0042]|nr:hypothetical protein BKA70DRAFT_1565945 [Coprinopsis sp. MPI-PUGE-AT-0042]